MRVLFVLVCICLAGVMAGFRKTVSFGGRYSKRAVGDDTIRPNTYLETAVRRDDEPCQRPYPKWKIEKYRLTIVRYRNQSIDDIAEFPSGAQLLVRCMLDPLYVLTGSHIITCKHGRWTSDMPTCEPTYFIIDYCFLYQGKRYCKCKSPVCTMTDVGILRVKKGVTVEITCYHKLTGEAPSLYKNGIKLQRDELTSIYSVYIDYVRKATPAFSGSYTCKFGQEQIRIEVVDQI